MSIYIVDVEADGPVPGLYSMVSFGAVRLDQDLKTTFYGKTAPITDQFIPEALAVSGHSREEHLDFPWHQHTMEEFAQWIKETNKDGRAILVSDNPSFDKAFISYYFHLCKMPDPFGHSARRIGDLYAGLTKDWFGGGKFKRFRKTKHTHNPVDDALGNAEALLEIAKQHGLRLPLTKVRNDD